MYPNNLKIPACFRNHFESKLGVEAFISHLFKKLIQINREINLYLQFKKPLFNFVKNSINRSNSKIKV